MNIKHKRQGQMDLDACYFFTETIIGFRHLLKDDTLKMACINSWKYLVDKDIIRIYAYVIMPNHIHLVWKMLLQNGMESPAVSFAKFTAHQFKKILSATNPLLLQEYASEKRDRAYQFWKRDPLAVLLDTESTMIQKINYVHMNPVKQHWNLADIPESYRWSSAAFYMGMPDEFEILTHYQQ